MSTLTGFRCGNCASLFLPPKDRCPHCGDDRRKEVQLSGRGTIRTSTIIHVAPTRYKDETPYTVVLVDLEEGVSLMGRLDVGQGAERGASVVLGNIDSDRGPTFDLATKTQGSQ